MSEPLKKVILENEEIVPVQEIKSDSSFIGYKRNNLYTRLDANNLINNEDIWCSSGNHGINDEIKIIFSFDNNYRIHALWIYWAFAPGEFRIQYSNDDVNYYDIFINKFRLTEQNSSISWWKKIISNPITRWQHRSFDERIEFENPIFAKFIIITMRIPVNKYFGIYKIEFYQKQKIFAMLKSKAAGKYSCLSIINGENHSLSYQPIIAQACLDILSYGDNRDLFILNSNNMITTFNGGLCLSSSTSDIVEISNCTEAEEYKDDRNKWIIEFNGLIRSMKNPETCLSLVDSSYKDYIPSDALKVQASSSLADDNHLAQVAIEYFDLNNYWASAPSLNNVIFQVLLFKYSANIKKIEINWKFPAKKFTVYALFSNGFWKVLTKIFDNREHLSTIYVMHYDIKGVKIIMSESTTKFEGQNIYGINKIYFKIQGEFIIRQSCDKLIDDINKWEIIDIDYTDSTNNSDMKKSFSDLFNVELKLERITKVFEKIPSKIIDISENSVKINEQLKSLNSVFEISKFKLKNFESLLKENMNSNNFVISENKYFPAPSCSYIRYAFPHKRSGFYWIKNECFPEPLKMYCDFNTSEDQVMDYYIVYDKEKYTKKSNDEFLEKQKELKNDSEKNTNDFNNQDNNNLNFNFSNSIKNENLKIDYFDLRKMCTDLGLEPIEISNLRSLDIIDYLIEKYDINLGNEIEFYGIPIGVDYDCIYDLRFKGSKGNNCKEKFKSLSSNKSIDLMNIIMKYMIIKNQKKENLIFTILENNDINENNNNNNNSDHLGGDEKDNSNDKTDNLKYLEFYEYFGFTAFKKFQKFSSLDTKVNAVVCSTLRNDLLKKKNSIVELKCQSNLKDLEYEIGLKTKNISNKNYIEDFNQEIAFLCPRNCANNYSSLVYGSDVYTDNSSICKAAIHSGILKNAEGGIALVIGTRGLDSYFGSKRFNIETLDYAQKWMRSFIIKKFKPYCAKDIIIDLEENRNQNKNDVLLSNDNKNQNGNKIIKNIKNIKNNNDSEEIETKKIYSNRENISEYIATKIIEENNVNDKNMHIIKNENILKDKSEDISNNIKQNNFKKKLDYANDLFNSNIDLENIISTNVNKAHNKNDNEILIQENHENFLHVSSFISLEENISNSISNDITSYESKLVNNLNSSKKTNKNQIEILIKFLEYLKTNKPSMENKINLNNLNDDSVNLILNNLLEENRNELSKETKLNNQIESELEQKNFLNAFDKKISFKENLPNLKKEKINNNDFNPIDNNIDNAIINLTNVENQEIQKIKEQKNKMLTKDEINNKILNFNDSNVSTNNPLIKLTTDEAIIQINVYIKFLRNQIKDILNFSEEFKKFVSKISSKITLLKSDKERGLIHQYNIIKAYLNKISTINKIIDKLEMISQAKIKRSEFNIFLLKKQNEKLMERENFYEDYSKNEITSNFEIFNPKNSQGSSSWDYYQLNSKGHNIVIKQKGETENNFIGSQLIILNRQFYDFELRFAVNINSEGTFGIAFRHKDKFNFYVAEISRKDKGFKRIRKFVNGVPSLLAEKRDGGYLPNRWLTFKILCTSTNIKVFYTQEEMQSKENSEINKNLELIFDIYDSEFTYGTVAFGSNLISNLFLDDISIKQISCTDFMNINNKKIDVLTNTCNKYIENFNHINIYWDVIDPLKNEGGPSNWTILKNFENRKILLGQMSEIYGSDENEEGTMLLLKNKICEKGIIKIRGKIPLEKEEFEEYINKKPKKAFGVIFKYKDNNNFYVLEIFNDSLIRFRKKIQGIYSLISQNPLMGFEYNKWFNLDIYIKNNHFNFRFFKYSNNNIYEEVFQNDIIDDDLKFGRIGILTFKTKAYFSYFETFKLDLIKNTNINIKNVLESPLFIDEEYNPEIAKLSQKINPLSEILKSEISFKSKDEKQINNIDINQNKNKNLLINLAINSKIIQKADDESESISKYNYILNQLNKNIPNYTWKTCLQQNTPEMKISQCENIFISENDINKCKSNFCPTCCNKFVGMRSNFKNHRYLCAKQCHIIQNPSNKVKYWSKCINPDAFSNSFYNYCDKVFQFDVIGNNRCKVDMCKLCCFNVEFANPSIKLIPQMTENLLRKCNQECIKCKSIYFNYF